MTEDKYQTGSKRLLAAIVDGLVFLPFLFLDNYVRNINNNGLIILSASIITLISIAYSVLLHAKYGQTLGKMAVGIKVLDVSENDPISLRQAFMRDSIWLIIEVIGILYFSLQIINAGNMDAILEQYDNFVGIVSLAWIILELVSMLTNPRRRAVHDYIAKTVVVRVK